MFKLAEAYGALVGRILMSLLFIISGTLKLTGFAGAAQYMANKGLPFVQLLLVLTILIELGGGLMLALGWHARWAALAIFLFVIPVTIIFHPVWADPAQKWLFWKNVFILGGMLYVMAHGSGPLSLDQRRN
jgi:putative oxidoreductase